MKRVLIVSYVFPPVGGAGVQRATKFAKYLPRHGWNVSVLTASNPSVPLFDASLAEDVPADTIIEKARTLEPPYAAKASVSGGNQQASGFALRRLLKSAIRTTATTLLQPDPQILWAPQAVRVGSRLLAQTHHDAIIATAPPFSSFVIGARLSRRFTLPLVLDYRDEWDISNAHWENRAAQGISSRWQARQQSKLLRSASAVLATTKASAANLEAKARQAGGHPEVDCIYNGFDPDDFPAPNSPPKRNDRFRVCYVGTLWKLTSVEPLVAGVRALAQRQPELAERLELAFYGRRTSDQESILRQLDATPCNLVLRDYVPHSQIPSLLIESDCLCMLLSDSPDAKRVVPAKLFEYMAAHRPILAIAPQGEVWDILRSHAGAMLHAPHDVDGIANSLATAIAKTPDFDDATPRAASEYSRDSQAKQLATLLDKVTGAARSQA